MGEAGTDSESERGEQGDIDSDEEFEELKRQAAHKQRAEEKQALRRHLKGDDPNLSIVKEGSMGTLRASIRERESREPLRTTTLATAKTMRICCESGPML
jgi:hypothetical protein